MENELDATAHELSSKKNADRLRTSIQQLRDSQVITKTLSELEEE
jgi:PHD/YefM family antitoxin component YafN of YafNO toxin-antitoxin module